MSQEINLVNPAFRKKQQSFSAIFVLRAGVIVFTAVIALIAYGLYQGKSLEKRIKENEIVLKSEQDKLVRLANELSPQRGKQLQDDIAKAEKELVARQEIMNHLKGGALGNTEGFSKHMRALARQSLDGLWLTGFNIESNEIAITGRTLNSELVPTYLRRLNRENVLKGRAFSSMRIGLPVEDVQTKDKQSIRFLEFNVSSERMEAESSRFNISETKLGQAK